MKNSVGNSCLLLGPQVCGSHWTWSSSWYAYGILRTSFMALSSSYRWVHRHLGTVKTTMRSHTSDSKGKCGQYTSALLFNLADDGTHAMGFVTSTYSVNRTGKLVCLLWPFSISAKKRWTYQSTYVYSFSKNWHWNNFRFIDKLQRQYRAFPKPFTEPPLMFMSYTTRDIYQDEEASIGTTPRARC